MVGEPIGTTGRKAAEINRAAARRIGDTVDGIRGGCPGRPDDDPHPRMALRGPFDESCPPPRAVANLALAMSAATSHTCAATKRLRDAGFGERRTEAAETPVRDSAGSDRGRLATKADLAKLEARLRSDRATKADVTGIRSELAGIRWTVGLSAAFVFAIGLRIFGLFQAAFDAIPAPTSTTTDPHPRTTTP